MCLKDFPACAASDLRLHLSPRLPPHYAHKGVSDTLVASVHGVAFLVLTDQTESENYTMKIETPIFVILKLAKLVVRGALNVRDHQAETFKRSVTDRRFRIQTEGWRDGEIKVCDDPEDKGRKVVLAGNITVSAALEGFHLERDIWDKLIPDGKVTVRDYGELTAAQMDFIIMDHGEVDLTLVEVYQEIERAFLADRGQSVDDLAVRFNDVLHKVLRGRKVELTGNEKYDREAISKRWRGLLTQNWMKHVQMRGVGPVYQDHLARLRDKDSALFGFQKHEYTKLHKAWSIDRDNEALAKINDSGFPPAMAKVFEQVLKDREDKAAKTSAPAVADPEMLTAEKVKELLKESPSSTVKLICAVVLGETVPEFADVEKWLVKAEQTKGSPFHVEMASK